MKTDKVSVPKNEADAHIPLSEWLEWDKSVGSKMNLVNLLTIYCNVEWPNFRSSIYALSELSNKEYQKENWTKACTDVWTKYCAIFETLDCDCVGNNDLNYIRGFIGSTLSDDSEALALYNMVDYAFRYIYILGEYKSNKFYLSSPLWDELVSLSKKALDVFLKNEEEAKKTNPCPWKVGYPEGSG